MKSLVFVTIYDITRLAVSNLPDIFLADHTEQSRCLVIHMQLGYDGQASLASSMPSSYTCKHIMRLPMVLQNEQISAPRNRVSVRYADRQNSISASRPRNIVWATGNTKNTAKTTLKTSSANSHRRKQQAHPTRAAKEEQKYRTRQGRIYALKMSEKMNMANWALKKQLLVSTGGLYFRTP